MAAAAAAALVALGLAPTTQHASASVHAAAPARAVLPAALGPTGQGVVASTACTETPAADPDPAFVTCNLWAKTGTLALSGATVPIWGFSTSAAGAASTPGPVLTATAGEKVVVNLTNNLSTELSLAFPGVTTGGLPGDDAAGAAATNGTKTYTFTAPAAGTYVYEAGHTDNGARQSAMGLVGALVVRPAGFVAGAPTLDGSTGTGFEDEAVLVLSEVDPAFNANPLTFDLRNFHPTYRLINGRSYPSTDPISTDHGRRTLLRYVNAGLLGHSMGVLGAKEEVLAVSAHTDGTRPMLVSDMVNAGQTEDVRVTFPAGGADSLPVYETAGGLNNAGQVAAVGSRIVGFGGMLTFLQAAPAQPGNDVTGPSVSGVTVTPDPATPLAAATVTANVSDVATGNSNIAQAELFVDGTNVVVGGGTAMTASDTVFDSPTEAVTGTLTTTALQLLGQGKHTVYVRAQDAAGNWGPASSVSFTMASTGPAASGLSVSPTPTNASGPSQLRATGDDSAIGGQVTAGEYFIDTTGSNGSGTSMSLTPGSVVAASASLSAATLNGLAVGSHTLYVHFLDSHNLWGPFGTVNLVVDRTGPDMSGGTVTPSPTNGLVGDPVDPTALKVHATFIDPAAGGVPSNVAAAEGFLETPGADGSGVVFVADDGSWNSTTESGYGTIPLSQLNGLAQGSHTVYVHGRDAAGNWGPLAPVSFVLDRGPTVAGAAATTVGVLGGPVTVGTATTTVSTVTAAEFYQGTDPGAGNGTALALASPGASSTALRLEPRSLSVGSHTLLVRAMDANGIWGKAVAVSVTTTGLFADGFESGGTAAWSSTSAGLGGAVTKAAAIDGTYGLNLTASNRWVQRNQTLTALHLGLEVNTGTLVTPTTGITLIQGRTTGGSQRFAVQYRNAGGVRQVRLVTNSVTNPSWVTVAAGVLDIRVTRTSTGQVTLSVNGVQVQGPSASSQTIGNIRVGIVSGTVSSGAIQIDSFGLTN